MSRGTKYCFTDFALLNWENIYNENKDFFRFVAWGEETCPTSGRKHLQGFLQLYTTRRMAAIKKIVKSKGLHLEVMKGAFAENEAYCKKEGQYTKMGEFVRQGQRTEWETVVERIKENGGNKEEIIELYPIIYAKFHGGIDKLCAHYKQKACNKWQEVKTTVLMGEAGSGKSSHVYKKHGYENVYTLDSAADDKFLCDGYAGEDVLLIDDFNGCIKYSTLLRLLDGHPMKLNVKGGRTYKNWTHVYITSNVTPRLWYKKIGDNLVRRIDSCHQVAKGVILEPLSQQEIKTKVQEWGGYG